MFPAARLHFQQSAVTYGDKYLTSIGIQWLDIKGYPAYTVYPSFRMKIQFFRLSKWNNITAEDIVHVVTLTEMNE